MSARSQISSSQGRLLKSNPGFVLRPDAAVAWDRACEKFGKRVLITGALRSLETQTRIFNERYEPGWRSGADNRYWPGHGWYHRVRGAAAAVPGTSNHGSGDAVDVKTRREGGDPSYDEAVVFTSWGDKDRVRFLRVAAEFGWDDDEGRRVDELWHLTYYPDRDRHRGSAPATPAAKKRKPQRLATLRLGNRGGRVKDLQRALISTGDLRGKADGVFGPDTEAGVRHFQKRTGLVVDGVVGAKTWFRLCQGLRKGSKNVRVRILKTVLGLSSVGVLGAKVGSVTAGRMREVQRWLGVEADGVFGPKTVAALMEKG